MSGILGEIAAAKMLAEDLYNFVCRLKSAGVDICDLDLKLQNDRFLLLRYHSVLSQRLSLLRDHEINHLRDYFRAISRVLLECAKKIEWYEKKSKLGKTIWCVFGDEIQDGERKVAEWIGGLMSWAVVVDADQRMLANVPNNSLQFDAHQRRRDHNSQQTNSTDDYKFSHSGHKRLLEHTNNAEASSNSQSFGPFDLQLIKDDIPGVSVGANSMPTRIKVPEPIRRTVWSDTVGHEASSDFDPSVRNVRRVQCQDYKSSKQIGFKLPFDEKGQLIGRGSYGNVYKVKIASEWVRRYTNTQRERQYAVKIFKSSNFEDFKNEAAALQKLSHQPHDHIIPLSHAWEENGIGHLLFPLAQGDLRSLLMNIPPTPGKRTEQWLLTQMTGVTSAVNSLHRSGGWHHDLKPENILFLHDQEYLGSQWMLSDFGFSHVSNGKRVADPLAKSSFPGNCQNTASVSSPSGTGMYLAPPQHCKHENNPSADMWALGCTFLEVLAWYFHPTGYTPRGFHHSRVQTIREHGDTAAEYLASARFWALDGREQPILHPSAEQCLNDIKGVAKSSQWLLDVPYHVERLLSIRAEARFRASELQTILQHGLALKKMALGDSTGPYAILDGRPLPKADFSLDMMGDSSTVTPVQQAGTAQTRGVSISNPLPCRNLSGLELARTQKMPSLKKSGKGTRDELRSQYLEH